VTVIALQVVIDLDGAALSETAAAALASSLTNLIGTAYLARAIDAGERVEAGEPGGASEPGPASEAYRADARGPDGFLDQWLSFRRLLRRMEHARSPAGRPHDTPTPEAIERAMRRLRTIMRKKAVAGLAVTTRSADGQLVMIAAFGPDPDPVAIAALAGAQSVIDTIMRGSAAVVGSTDPGTHRGLDRAEAQRAADGVGPTHPRASSNQFAVLDDGYAATAVMALADRRILSCDLTG
jgi:hypothetical protein